VAISSNKGETAIYKVRAHKGTTGNEQADLGAKRATTHNPEAHILSHPTTVPNDTQNETAYMGYIGTTDRELITNPKKQLRPLVRKWLMKKKNYARTTLDMWTNPPEPHDLDAEASNSIWGKGVSNEIYKIHQTLRARFLELVTGQMLADRAAPPGTTPPQIECPLQDCKKSPDNWTHMLMLCNNPDLRDYYTKRHNSAGKALLHSLTDSTWSRWLTLSNFGRIDGNPQDEMVPEWMLGPEARARILALPKGERGINPDVIVLENWPSNEPPPTKPGRYRMGTGGHEHVIKLHVIELGFCSDFQHPAKYAQKQNHYAPLLQELAGAGWTVHKQVHVITIGARATVPVTNNTVLASLGNMDAKSIAALQKEFVWIAAKHAGDIIAQSRKLHRECRRNNGQQRLITQRAGVG
jgi:hypothetical protein